jgi:hypothetical protein
MPPAVSPQPSLANVFAKVRSANSVQATAKPIAIAFFLVCIVTAYSGANLLVFLHGVDRVADALDSFTENTQPSPAGELNSFIAKWKNTAGIADVARMQGLTVVRTVTPDDKAAIELAASEIAENSPTSSRAWQDLAQARLERGAPMESVLAAFHISDLTGSHEAPTMMQRAIFGLDHWSELPEAERQVVVRNMVATIVTIESEHMPQESYRKILAAKSEAERDQVRAALTKFGLATPAVLQALGE